MMVLCFLYCNKLCIKIIFQKSKVINISEGTYFSENALLPGLVQGGFDEDVTAKKLFLELRGVLQSSPNEVPFDWLIQKFNEIGMDAYLHNFKLTYPLANNKVCTI